MAICLNFTSNRLSETVLLYSLTMKPWYRAHLYDCIINILRVMAQFINFGNGGHFRLKKGFPQG